ncbi:MAG TPA: nucleotidyltransferase family protein [Noviherbaspirillum sp.]|uniref:nucleotidyltransferase family protein n=1 Tax=Noviherbaspirillum sp. TaxID=1926288 RepID=UPI002D682167|nr:nucleotidyltransferase family protein [Noviherbaspirillum sp.]HYD97558.1 nucleotidyltransferase family protein [Noviherbaspirillum sp.]
MFAILLLAAGHGRRFRAAGGDGCKLLAETGDSSTVLLRAYDVLAVTNWPIHVVTGAFDKEIRQALLGRDANFICNPDGGSGLGSTIACGVKATPEADGWLVALGDMPFIRADTILRVARRLEDGAALVFPAYKGKRGHPVGFSRRFYRDLLALDGDAGARRILDAHPDACIATDVDDAGVLRDVDLPSDLHEGTGGVPQQI